MQGLCPSASEALKIYKYRYGLEISACCHRKQRPNYSLHVSRPLDGIRGGGGLFEPPKLYQVLYHEMLERKSNRWRFFKNIRIILTLTFDIAIEHKYKSPRRRLQAQKECSMLVKKIMTDIWGKTHSYTFDHK